MRIHSNLSADPSRAGDVPFIGITAFSHGKTDLHEIHSRARLQRREKGKDEGGKRETESYMDERNKDIAQSEA